jgi:hypothetical protein
MSIFLKVAGAVLFLAGLGMIASRQSEGFNLILKNFGINFGGKFKQRIKVGNSPPGAAKETKHDWVGLAIAAIGLLTALVGWLKG